MKIDTLKLIILDMDMTIVIPKNESFYAQYGQKTEEAIAAYFGVSHGQALDIANDYRQKCGGAEHALFCGDHKPVNYDFLHEKLSQINAKGAFKDRSHLRSYLRDIRDNGVKIIVLTSSPDHLARRILQDSGLHADHDFDAIYGYTKTRGPQKIIHGKKAFVDVMNDFDAVASETMCIGDNIMHDIDPALSIGIDGYVITPKPLGGYKTITNLEEFLKTVTKKLNRRPTL